MTSSASDASGAEASALRPLGLWHRLCVFSSSDVDELRVRQTMSLSFLGLISMSLNMCGGKRRNVHSEVKLPLLTRCGNTQAGVLDTNAEASKNTSERMWQLLAVLDEYFGCMTGLTHITRLLAHKALPRITTMSMCLSYKLRAQNGESLRNVPEDNALARFFSSRNFR